MSPGHFSGIDREGLIRSIDKARGIANQRFQQRGFAGAVSSNQRDLLSPAHRGDEVMKHAEASGCAIVRFRELFDFERMSSRRLRHIESDERTLNIGSRQLGRLKPLHFLFPRLNL